MCLYAGGGWEMQVPPQTTPPPARSARFTELSLPLYTICRIYGYIFLNFFENFDLTAGGRGRSFADQPHATDREKKVYGLFIETRTNIETVR